MNVLASKPRTPCPRLAEGFGSQARSAASVDQTLAVETATRNGRNLKVDTDAFAADVPLGWRSGQGGDPEYKTGGKEERKSQHLELASDCPAIRRANCRKIGID